MKQMKKLTALLLSVVLLTGVLASCSKSGAEASPTPTEKDMILELAGISRDTTLFTVDGAEVTAEQYLFWLAKSVSSIDQYAQSIGQEGINWEEDMSENEWAETMAEYCKNGAMDTAKLYALLELHAQQEDCAFNDENAADCQNEMDDMISQLGGQEKYELWLSANALSQSGVAYISRASYNYQNLQNTLYGEGGKNAPTDESIDAYILENDLLSAKHILLLTVDMSNQDATTGAFASLEADVIAQKEAKAEDILAQLRASDDPTTLFDTLMHENSEDSGLSSNPDGYEFTSGNMAAEFETATRALEIGEISDIVQSRFGYHIILRQDPDTETLRSRWISDDMDVMMEGWVTDAVVETTSAYDEIDPQTFYTNLLAHQAEIEAQLTAEESAAASPSPTDSAVSPVPTDAQK